MAAIETNNLRRNSARWSRNPILCSGLSAGLAIWRFAPRRRCSLWKLRNRRSRRSFRGFRLGQHPNGTGNGIVNVVAGTLHIPYKFSYFFGNLRKTVRSVNEKNNDKEEKQLTCA